MGGIARENAMTALAVGGTANHAHALLALPATITVAQALQLIKGGSSLWLHDTFPSLSGFAWQEGYAAFNGSQHFVLGYDRAVPTGRTVRQ